MPFRCKTNPFREVIVIHDDSGTSITNNASCGNIYIKFFKTAQKYSFSLS